MEYSRNHAELTPLARTVLEQPSTAPENAPAQTDISPAASAMARVLNGQNTDAESTSVNTNPAEHTPVEQRVIDEYQNSTDTGLVDFVQRAAQNPGGKDRYTLNPVSDRAAADIKNITGVDTAGNQTVLESRMAEHILQRHGENGAADHSMRDLNDLGRIQYVLDNYDSVVDGGTTQSYVTNADGKNRPAKTVLFSKAVNGTYYVVEAVPDTTKHTTYIVTAYMTKNKPTSVQSPDAFAPAQTAKTEADLPVGTQNVSQAAPNVNTEGVETRLSQTAETVRDASITPDAVKQSINENIENGGYRYIPVSNDSATSAANANIAEKGFDSVLREWTADVNRGQTGSKLSATGAVLYNEAIRSGNTRLALDILSDYQLLGTNTAQGLQAMRIIQSLTPEGRLYMMQQDVKKLSDGRGEAARRKLPEGYKIDPELADAFLNAKDEAAASKKLQVNEQRLKSRGRLGAGFDVLSGYGGGICGGNAQYFFSLGSLIFPRDGAEIIDLRKQHAGAAGHLVSYGRFVLRRNRLCQKQRPAVGLGIRLQLVRKAADAA